jgi:hypothetical protein
MFFYKKISVSSSVRLVKKPMDRLRTRAGLMSPLRLRSFFPLKNPSKAWICFAPLPSLSHCPQEDAQGAESTSRPVEDKPLTEEQIEEATTGMSDTQKRLFKIKLKINQGRKANKEEVEREFKRLSDPSFKRREYAAQRAENATDEAHATGPVSPLFLSEALILLFLSDRWEKEPTLSSRDCRGL